MRWFLLPALLLGAMSSNAAEVASSVVGYNRVDCPGGSDTVVSVPFHRPASFSGLVDGTPNVSGGAATVAVQGTDPLVDSELVGEAHYLVFTDGGGGGSVFPITANDTGSITIDTGSGDLAGVADGDRFQAVPYWTLATLFPVATQTAIHLSGGMLSPQRKSTVLFFDESTGGTDLAPDRIFFATGDGWFRSASGFPAADDEIVRPGAAFVIRHPQGEAATAFYPHQVVSTSAFAVDLRTRSEGPQDNAVSLVRPVPVRLADLDLGAPAFLESASNGDPDRKDELLVYDNTAALLNKTPSTIYFRAGGEWRLDDDSSYPNADDDEISPSAGLVIRKASTAGGETLQWLNTPRY